MLELTVLFLLLVVLLGVYLKHRETMRIHKEEGERNKRLLLPLPPRLGGIKPPPHYSYVEKRTMGTRLPVRKVPRLTPYNAASAQQSHMGVPGPTTPQSSDNDLLAGVIIGAIGNEILHHHHDRGDVVQIEEPSISSGGGGDFGGGGASSDWGSSDSSSSDSGSSTDSNDY
jgi:hypothetical protein